MGALEPAYGRSITLKGRRTLQHFEFNPSTDKLEGDRTFQTLLASYDLGEQHTISSGGENIFIKNNTSGIHYAALSSGLKDHEQPANQGSDGIVIPFARSYDKTMQTVEANGALLPTGAVELSSSSIVVNNVVIFGIEVVAAQRVLPEDVLSFNSHFGPDNSSIKVFQQSLTGLDLFPGDRLIWFFDEPAETRQGQLIYAEIVINSDAFLQVRPGATNPLAPYSLANVRVFDDLPVILKAPNGDSTTFKLLKLTGTTGPVKGDITLVAHGIDYTKIITLGGTIIDDNDEVTSPGSKSTGNSEYFIKADDTNLILTTSQAFGGDVLSKEFQVMVTFED